MKRITAYVAKIEKNNEFTENNPMEEIEDRHDGSEQGREKVQQDESYYSLLVLVPI